MKTKQVYLWIFLLFLSRNTFGTSMDVLGPITYNTIWDTDTVKITGDIIVNDSVTLIITPGTHVRFQGFYKIEINGRLLAQGTPQHRIDFTSEDTMGYTSGNDIGWAGIIFNNPPSTNDSSKIEYSILTFCKSASISVLGMSKLSVSNNEINNNQIGIFVFDNSQILLYNNKISYNKSVGIKVSDCIFQSSNSFIYNNYVLWNMGSGIEITNCSNLLINHNIICHNNGYGIEVVWSILGYNIYTLNNIICRNGGAGIRSGPTVIIYVSNSTICYNGEGLELTIGQSIFIVKNTILWNYGGKFFNYPMEITATTHTVAASANYCLVQGGFKWRETYHEGMLNYDNIISEEPRFVDPVNDDYSLLANSPCINNGSPGEIQPDDVDIIGNSRSFGGRIDIGAFEFTNVCPQLVVPINNYSFFEDSLFMFEIPDSTFKDNNFGDKLIYQAKLSDNNPLPEWLLFDSITRKFYGMASNVNVGTYSIVVTAIDLFSAAISDTFNIEIVNTNDQPILAKPISDQVLAVYLPYTFIIPDSTFIDPDIADSLKFSISLIGKEKLPQWLIFDTNKLVLHGTPLMSDTGNLYVLIYVTDLNQSSCIDTFCLEIVGNPVYSISNYEVDRKLVLYPNPADNIIYAILKGNWSANVNITVYDLRGRICYFDENDLINTPHIINLKALDKGIYFMKVFDGKHQITSSFILK